MPIIWHHCHPGAIMHSSSLGHTSEQASTMYYFTFWSWAMTYNTQPYQLSKQWQQFCHFSFSSWIVGLQGSWVPRSRITRQKVPECSVGSQG
jgi:hypothetical protein